MRVYNYPIVIAALLNGRSSGSVESLFEQDTGPMTVDGSDNPGNGVPGAGETQQALFSWWDLNGGPQREALPTGPMEIQVVFSEAMDASRSQAVVTFRGMFGGGSSNLAGTFPSNDTS